MENPGYNPDSSIAIPEGALDTESGPPSYFDLKFDAIANPGYNPDTDGSERKPKSASQLSDGSTLSAVSSNDGEMKLYARRWVILAIFSLNTMMNEVIIFLYFHVLSEFKRLG